MRWFVVFVGLFGKWILSCWLVLRWGYLSCSPVFFLSFYLGT
jgi:hypothetical protein